MGGYVYYLGVCGGNGNETYTLWCKGLLEQWMEQIGWGIGHTIVAIAVGSVCAYGNKPFVRAIATGA